MGVGCQPGLTCKAVLPKRFRASGCTSSRCRRRRTSCTSPRAAAPLSRSPTWTSSRSIVTRVVCETHPVPSSVQVKAQEPASAGSEHEGFPSLGLLRHWGLLKVIPRPQTLRSRTTRFSHPAPPPVTVRGGEEPRPALGRPPLGPGLPRLTLPPRLGRAWSAPSRSHRSL